MVLSAAAAVVEAEEQEEELGEEDTAKLDELLQRVRGKFLNKRFHLLVYTR